MEWTNQELTRLWANTEKRKGFLANYKEWGVWITVSELGLTYYKYELPKDGGRILAMEYQRQNPYPRDDENLIQTIVVYYLWEGEYFIPNTAGEYFIIDRLKKLNFVLLHIYHLIKFVQCRVSSNFGSSIPASCPAFMDFIIQARLCAKTRIVCIPSRSCRTSSGVFPCTIGQYCEPTITIWDIVKYLFSCSNAAVEPARRQLTIAAPGLCVKTPLLLKNRRFINDVICPEAAA